MMDLEDEEDEEEGSKCPHTFIVLFFEGTLVFKLMYVFS